jgi:FkbM family methyltransferase
MKLENIKFESGNLAGITLCMDKDYSKSVFPNNNTDPEMISDIQKSYPKGKTIFDVGAFIGSSSLLFSKLITEEGKVIAFEPNSYNFDRIKKNLSLNKKLSKNIKVFKLALSDIEGETPMLLSKQIDDGYSSTSRLTSSHSTLHSQNLPNGFEEQKVPVTTLDTFIQKHNFTPDIIKVDIEGAEHDFIKGAKKTIKKYKPVLYIEIHSEYCAVKCYEILNSLDYHIIILKEWDDNRIMVKAEYFKNRKSLYQDQKERIIKLSTRIKDLKKFNATLNKNLKIAKKENNNLKKEIKVIKDLLEKRENEILRYQNSLSWKLTKPFRIISTKIKDVKKTVSS